MYLRWYLLWWYFLIFCQYAAAERTNNWAVLVGTSKFWFNYRHMSNVLGIYRNVKRLGIPDSHIIVMLADDVACNPRNSFAGSVYSSAERDLDLYGDHIEVDYRGSEVTVENFIRLLTGRLDNSYPRSKRLDTDENSNILVYMTGHGGDEFLKFQDYEEISAYDLADVFGQMHSKRRYNEIFFMVDTCQASTMYSKFYSPGILATACSQKDENSYSHHSDRELGVAVIDRYTRYILKFLESINKTSTATLQDMFDGYNPVEFRSNASVRTDLFARPVDEVLVTDFFGGVSDAEISSINNNPNAKYSLYHHHYNNTGTRWKHPDFDIVGTLNSSISRRPSNGTTFPATESFKYKAAFVCLGLLSIHAAARFIPSFTSSKR